MIELTDAKPVFMWAREHGDTRIIERILVKILPSLIEQNLRLTVEQVETVKTLMLPADLVKMISKVAKELTGSHNFKGDYRV